MGKLYICGTPIGNLEDVSLRLLRILKEVDLIACEDTRHTHKLLSYYNISNRLSSYHEHSKEWKDDAIIADVVAGKSVALVTDAGMPGISDPGQRLINKAIVAGIEMEVIPGPSALICALSISGLETQRFVFEGFIHRNKTKRREMLGWLRQEPRTIILYEAPHRLLESLEDIEDIMGADRQGVIARELTKQHEEIIRGNITELRAHFQQNAPRGEICILIAGCTNIKKEAQLEEVLVEVERLITGGINKNEAFKLKAREYNLKKSDIYNLYEDRHR